MKVYLDKALIKLGLHGKRHRISHIYVNLVMYKRKQLTRLKQLLDWMRNNGVGVDKE